MSTTKATRMRQVAYGAALTVAILIQSTLAQTCSSTLRPQYSNPVVAGGWSFRLVANGFTRPRGIVFDQSGALLVVDSRVGVVRLTLTDDGGTCLSVKNKTIVINAPELNHGIAFSGDGRILYASTADKVYSWTYDFGTGTVSNSNRTLVTGMANSDHTTRTLLMSQRVPGMLIVSRGSASNIDSDAADILSGHSQLKAFDIGALRDDLPPYDFTTQGSLLGWGLRNSVGVAEHPITGGIWSVENSVDQLERNGQDIHQNNPGEELNFHGYLNGSTESQGGNYGYPNCFALWSTSGFPDLGQLKTGDQFSASQTNNLNDQACAQKYVAPRLTFQAHTAPLDIKFNSDGTMAFVTFHGSWNRDEPVGYKLSSIAFANGQPVAKKDSMESNAVLSNADLNACPGDCFRPVGLAWDKNGRLWMTSDSTGEVYVLHSSDLSATGGGPTPGSTPNAAPQPSVGYIGEILMALAVSLLSYVGSMSLLV